MFRAVLLSSFIILTLAGCGTYLNSYELAGPRGGGDSVYENGDMVVEMSIVDDEVYGLRIENKTDNPMSIFWKNSTARNAEGDQVPVDAVLVEGEGEDSGRGVTEIKPGGRIYAEAFPVENVYAGAEGTTMHYPLYYVGAREGKASDIEGKPIGIRLVVGVNGRTRMLPLMLTVTPSRFSI